MVIWKAVSLLWEVIKKLISFHLSGSRRHRYQINAKKYLLHLVVRITNRNIPTIFFIAVWGGSDLCYHNWLHSMVFNVLKIPKHTLNGKIFCLRYFIHTFFKHLKIWLIKCYYTPLRSNHFPGELKLKGSNCFENLR